MTYYSLQGKSFDCDTFVGTETNEQKEIFKQAADSFKIISIKVNGNTAVAVYNDFNPVKKRDQQTTATFAKRNGKWLLVREITKILKGN